MTEATKIFLNCKILNFAFVKNWPKFEFQVKKEEKKRNYDSFIGNRGIEIFQNQNRGK